MPVDNMWTTLPKRAQVVHILATYLTHGLRSRRSQRAAVAVSSRVRLVLWGALCLSAGLLTTSMQPVQAATQADYLKLYAHSRILDWKQYHCLVKIITKESQWNPKAINGSHYGLGQMKSKWYKNLDPYRQIDETIRYITNRYKTPCKAWAFHQKAGHY